MTVSVTLRPPSFDVGHAEELLLAAARGDDAAFAGLVELIWPDLGRGVASSRRLAADGDGGDGPHDVGARIIEKLQHDEYRALRLYEDWRLRHPEKTLLDWLHIIADNVTRDCVRELKGHSANDDVPSPKQVMNAFAAVVAADHLGTRPPMTWGQTARQLLEFAGSRLEEPQCRALEDWLSGASFDQIAEAQAMSGGAASARRSVRAAIAVLRRELSRS